MDNLTHTLVGALVGEAAHDIAPGKLETQSRRILLLTTSMIANNFPDLDGVYTRIMPPPLGYLLHHRGHTHTLLLLIPQLLLVLGFLFLIPSFRQQLRDRKTLKLTILVGAIGLLLHMLLDSWNSYGIHPFYPFSSRWFYGDLVFILEPFLWFAFASPLFFTFHSKWTRWPLAVAISAVPIVAAAHGFLNWYSVGAVFSFALITMFFAQRALTVTKKAFVGVTAAVIFLVTQAVTASNVREAMRAEFKPISSDHKILDLVLTALPANPFCWSVLQIESDRSTNKYFTEGKIVSSWPEILPASACLAIRLPGPRTETTLGSLSEIISRDCYADAWFRFGRAPLIESGILSDLRFSQRQEQNFSTLRLSEEVRECPRFIPPWSKPRQDLLDDAHAVAPINRQYKE